MGSESQLTFLYIIMRAEVVTLSASGGKPLVQNGDSGSYMYAVFELLVHKEAEIWTSLLHRFIK